MKTILSLCDYSGVWSQPYRSAGYNVVRVDVALNGIDVCSYVPEGPIWGVLAAPPCTCFCRPAARWWDRQDADGATARNIAVLRACLNLARLAEGWWALENPPGRHRKLIPELGPPAWQYQPFEFGDPWGKQTYIWGTAVKPPVVAPVAPAPTRFTSNRWRGRIDLMSSSWKRQREQTPGGFAKAFFLANP